MYSGEIPSRPHRIRGFIQARLGKKAVANFAAGLDYLETPEALVRHIDSLQAARGTKAESKLPKYTGKDEAAVRTAEPAEPRNRRRNVAKGIGIGALVVALGGGVLYGKYVEDSWATSDATTAAKAVQPSLAIPDKSQRQDIISLAQDCIGKGSPQTISVTIPKSEAISFEAIVGAVEQTGRVKGSCPMPEFAAELAVSNAYENPGLVPEPYFNPAKIEQDTPRTFAVIAPQSVQWK